MNLGYTAEECAEVLACLRDHDLGLPDTVLQELADNFQWEARIGFDMVDIPAILNQSPGNKIVVRAVAESANKINSAVHQLLRDAVSKGVEKSTAMGAIFIVKSGPWGSHSMPMMKYVLQNVREFLHEDASAGGTLYQDKRQGDLVDLMVIFGGI